MSAVDILSVISRNFYERTRGKLILSLISGAAALVSLGFTSQYGGLSTSSKLLANSYEDNALVPNSYKAANALAAGYGFGTAVFFFAFVLLLAATIYISPTCCGSVNEKKMIQNPQELDTGYAAYSDQPSSNATRI